MQQMRQLIGRQSNLELLMRNKCIGSWGLQMLQSFVGASDATNAGDGMFQVYRLG
jgi:hypothetical protein